MAEITEQHSPGARLSAAREQNGFSIEHVARQLRLAPALVTAMESDARPADVPPPFYRGYLRAYAKLVGVDAEMLVDGFNRGRPDEARIIGIQNLQTLPSGGAGHASLWRKLLPLVLVLVVVAAGWWVWQQGWLQKLWTPAAEAPAATESAPVETTPAVATPAGELPLNLPPDDSVPVAETAETGAAPAGDSTATPAAATSEKSVATEAAPTPAEPAALPAVEAGAEQLEFVFVEDCWVRVMDARGDVLAIGTKKKGHRMTLVGPAPIAVTLGNVLGVQIRQNGMPVDLSKHPGGKPVSFSLDARRAE